MKDRIYYLARCASYPSFLIGGILTIVGVCFNVSHGIEQGGSDPLKQFGMGFVFLAAIIAKDASLGKTFTSIRERRFGLAIACLGLFVLGALTSAVGAIGAASEGREERSDPRAAQIEAYKTAKKVEAEAEARLKEIGRTATVGEAEANVAKLLATVDTGISRRTKGCVDMAPEGSGKRQVEANNNACQDVISARAKVSAAKDADKLRADLKAARETISKGAPKSADPGAEKIAAVLSKLSSVTTSEGMSATGIVFLIAIFVEVGAPFAWLVFQLSAPTFSKAESDLDVFRRTISGNLPEPKGATVAEFLAARLPETDPEPPKPRKKMKPTFSGNVVPFAGKHAVIEAIEANGGTVESNRELARLMGVSEGEATKRRAEVAHLLVVGTGKVRRVTLKSA